MMRSPLSLHLLLVPPCAIAFSVTASAQAQLIPDNTLENENSVIAPGVIVQGELADLIEGGAQRGSNLFHSFETFNIDAGQRVYFANPTSIESILSRVTGGDPSNIFGTLGVDGAADLFLINPNGIVFGETASLNVSGSFYATTADAISLGEGVYSATEPQNSSLLTIAPEVSFFNYLTAGSGNLTNDAQLTAGGNLALAGQNLQVQGSVTAGGDLSLLASDTVTVRDTVTDAFVAQAGNALTIQGNQGVDILALNHLQQTPFVSGGDLTLVSDGVISADAHFDVGGSFSTRTLAGELANFGSLEDPIFDVADDFAVGDYTGASLQVTAGNDITYGEVEIDAIDPAVDPNNPAFLLNAGGSIIGTGEVSTSVDTGGLVVDFVSEGNIEVADITTDGGPITLTSQAGGIILEDLDTRNGNNPGGNITLTAVGDIMGDGDLESFSRSNAENTGDGGVITISSIAGNITIDGELASFSRSEDGDAGNGGTISITATGGAISISDDIESSSRSDDGNTANSGAISITAAGDVAIADDVTSQSRSENGNAGNGGAVEISSDAGNVTIEGEVVTRSRSDEGNAGDGGAVAITATVGTVALGDKVESISRSDEGNAGNGGAITITADGNVTLEDGSLDAHSEAEGDVGNGGDVTVFSLSGDIALDGSANSSSQSESGNAGNGGAISMTAASGNILIENNLNANAESKSDSGNSGAGGPITIVANSEDPDSGNITLGRDVSSESESRGNSAGSGGDISISATGNVLIDRGINSRSRLRSDSETAGGASEGGSITITSDAGDITLTDGSLESSSSTGNNGTVSDGGAITITAFDGNVEIGEAGNTQGIDSRSVANNDDSGNGGPISITAESGAVTIYGQVDARSGKTGSEDFIGNAGNGGAVTITADGDVTLVGAADANNDAVDTGSRSSSGNAGNGGTIDIESTFGSVNIDGNFDSFSFSANEDAGNGGAITIAAVGEVSINGELQAFSLANGAGDASNGGPITISSTESNIRLFRDASTIDAGLASFSFSQTGNASNGAPITLRAPLGIIQGDNNSNTPINTFAVSSTGETTERGGPVILEAIDISNVDILTFSSAGDSGDVRISNIGQTLDLEVDNLNLITSGQVQVFISFLQDLLPNGITVNLDDFLSQSGATVIESDGDINFNNVSIQADANGTQPAGNVEITSPGQIAFNNSQINTNANSSGQGGLIEVTAGESIQLLSNSQLQAQSFADGRAGDIELSAPEINIENSDISTSTEGAGQAGDVRIEAERFSLNNGAQILAPTASEGNGGTIVIDATNTIEFGQGVQDFAPVISVEASGSGRPGNVFINTPTFVLSETASITATATETATNEEGGSITLSADQMNLEGTVGIFAETQGEAPGGVLTLQPYQPSLGETNPNLNVMLAEGAEVSASTTSSGNGGDLVISAPNTIDISGPGRLAVETSGSGDAGDIDVTAQRATLSGGVTLSASTTGSGTAGDITFNITDDLTIDGSNVTSNTESEGNAGAIFVETERFRLRNGGSISAATSGAGEGGGITITAATEVLLGEGVQDSAPIISVEASEAGKPGDITINTPNFVLSETAEITATATDEASNIEEGGSITLNADQMNLAGTVGIFAETQGTAPGGVLTLQPYQTPNLNLTLAAGAEVSASTTGSGRGGDLAITAPNTITVSGPGLLAVETSGSGPGGNIELTSQNLNIFNGTIFSAATTGPGAAGDITFNIADNFTMQNGELRTISTQGSGGSIEVFASDIRFSGDSDIRSNVISGEGRGGDITLTANTIILFDDSDILAFSADGIGGNILLDTPVFFGENYQPAPQLSTLEELEALDGNDQVDVNATGSIATGTIAIPDNSFIENSLNELSGELVSTETLTAGSCIARSSTTEGSFVITGTDGLPQRPGDDAIATYPTGVVRTAPETTTQALQEPDGVYQLADGRLVLSQACTP
ncbi:MAG: filamentous hemagglutinin N-terminal domain-containing protein [Cyanobacteria bacterium J06639_14]